MIRASCGERDGHQHARFASQHLIKPRTLRGAAFARPKHDGADISQGRGSATTGSRGIGRSTHAANSCRSAFASFRSRVSNPSVNQP